MTPTRAPVARLGALRDAGHRRCGMALTAVCGALLIASLIIATPVLADELAEVQSLVKQGNLPLATDRLNAFLAKNPKDARGRFLRGLILTEQKRPSEAIRVFIALTEDFPELPEPYNNLAVLYAAQGQFDRARQMLELAIRTHPSYATAHENLGDIYAKMASEAYDRALQLDRSNALVQTKLSLIRELFSNNPKFQRPPLLGEAGRPVAGAGQPATAAASAPAAALSAASSVQATKGAAPPSVPAAASSRLVAARSPDPTPSSEPLAKQAAAAVPASSAASTQAAAPPTRTASASPAAASPAGASPALAATTAGASPLPPAAPSTSTVPGSEEIVRTVEQWARAWSNNDVNAYLGFYAKDFKVPGGSSRADWEKTRGDRIAKPKKIEVKVLEPQVKAIAGNRLSVSFRQDYRSPSLKSQTPKTLVFVRAGSRWLIEQEQVGR